MTAQQSTKQAIRHYDFRCRSCGRLLFRGHLPKDGHIQIRCPRCGKISVFEIAELEEQK